mgnify:CR=1 FL=1
MGSCKNSFFPMHGMIPTLSDSLRSLARHRKHDAQDCNQNMCTADAESQGCEGIL